jgi:EAL domain-containing protein (putative c-di-GMP-specific phosphodiesterase class I)/GGDEF domain-containing protein
MDTLTKIPNNTALQIKLKETKFPTLLLIDIKDFKQINLKHTDQAGDFVLRSYADSLKNFASENEMQIFRVRDDEFALLKDCTFDLDNMEKLILNFRNFDKNIAYNFENNTIKISTNIGISFDIKGTFEKAKLALKLAKRENQPFFTYSFFATTLLEENEGKIAKIVEDSIASGHIVPHFQKIVDKNEKVIFYETLIRILSQDSFLSPKFFLEIARKKGFYNTLVKTLCKKLIIDKKIISINLLFEDLLDDDLFSFLTKYFKDKNYIFELQYQENLDLDLIVPKLKTLNENHIKICLDNVVNITNLSGMRYIDYIKVRGNLVRSLCIDENSKLTCSAIIQEGKKLGCKTIASQINSISSFNEAKKLGFDYFQGFLFSQPQKEIN